jgi:hypothetical protein
MSNSTFRMPPVPSILIATAIVSSCAAVAQPRRPIIPTATLWTCPRPPPAAAACCAPAAGASLESIHDLQFKAPAFMGQQYRGKVLLSYGEPVHNQYYATVAVRRDSAAQLVVEHLVRAG